MVHEASGIDEVEEDLLIRWKSRISHLKAWLR